MGKLYDNEIALRNQAKEVRSLILEKHDIEKAIEIISDHEEILTYNYGRNAYLSLLPTVRLEKGLKNKYEYMDKIIKVGFEIYQKSKNYEESVFYAAAKCDVENLHLCMKFVPKEDRNKTKEGDTILLFFIKYANLENSNYLKTLQTLVNEYKVDVNKADYRNHSPIIILLEKYVSLQRKHVTQYDDIILNAVSIILTRNNVDLISHRMQEQNAQDIIELYCLNDILEKLKMKNTLNRIDSDSGDGKSILFTLLSERKEDEFLQRIKEISDNENPLDIEDGYNTILQLACEKNLPKVVSYLLQQGVSLTKVTKRNKKTPLEIAARRNYYSIFKDLLKENKIIVDSSLFAVFLLNRGRQIKTKYFEEILCYDGLPVDIAYDNGNTPLHYAIIFSNTEATLKLLKRGASLSVKNKNGKDALDYIGKEDLELYMDLCVLLDRHNKLFDKKYEVVFDLSGFVKKKADSDTVVSETDVASKICSSERLTPLAKHPLMMVFIEIKWNLVKSLYNKILLLYLFFFVYSFVLTVYVGHITFLYLVITSLLIFFTVQPSAKLKNWKSRDLFSPLLHTSFTFLVYYLFRDVTVTTFFFVFTLFYQFLQQHLYFSKYQAFIVSGFRKVTPYLIALFALYYCKDFGNNFKYSKLNVIMFLVIFYIILITHSFNALADSISDIEYSLKTVYNKNTLDFITFYENIYSFCKTILDNPFIYENFDYVNPKRKRANRHWLHFYLNRSKFVHEKFHFLRLDVPTVKKLQDFVAKEHEKIKQGSK